MHSVVGIFDSRSAAENSVRKLLDSGISEHSIIFLTGEAGATHAKALPVADAEPQAGGEATGALVGGAVGVGAGLPLGGAIASFLVPGVGTIFAFGLGAAAWLGLSGAAVGAMVAERSEEKASEQPDTPLTKDDTAFYHGLLKRRRSLVVVHVEGQKEASTAHTVLHQSGAQDVERARKELHDAA